MYRSYSVNNMPTPITYEPRDEKKPVKPERHEPPKEKNERKEKKNGLLDNIQTDDVILIIVVLALLLDDCEDKLLIAALGFIFISEFL